MSLQLKFRRDLSRKTDRTVYALKRFHPRFIRWVLTALIAIPVPAWAQSTGQALPSGMVRSFHGLLELEKNPNISDQQKTAAWQAFTERTEKQLEYAKQAAAYWQEADRLRWLETARRVDRKAGLLPRQRLAQWQTYLDKYPSAPELDEVRTRVKFWRQKEVVRLIQAAETVEANGYSKVDRIQAWLSLTQWAPRSREAKAAFKRIEALQNQLFREANSVDGIARVDRRTKVEAWQDVLNGHPSLSQKQRAAKRISILSAREGS